MLSTSTASPDSLSTTFASNAGASPVTVYSASYTFTTANTGTPKPFDMLIPFAAPFAYDPASGTNLVVDVITSSAVTNGTNVMRLDSDFGVPAGSGVGSVLGDATAATGQYFTGGLIGEFTFTPVPEPASLGLLGLGLLAQQGARGTGVSQPWFRVPGLPAAAYRILF